MKKTLSELGSKLWLKWANDLYIKNKKIGGVLTSKVGDNLICGIGINLKYAPKQFTTLDIFIDRDMILTKYFNTISKKLLWKEILLEFEKEFEKSKNLNFTYKNKKISLKNATLNSDGSIKIGKETIYSLR